MRLTTKRYVIGGALFSIISILAYSIWAFGARAFPDEISLYAAITLCFLTLGGLAIYAASARRASLVRTWSAVAVGFIGFGVIWSVGWFWLGDTHGETFGNLFGWLFLAMISRTLYRGPKASLLIPVSIAFLSSTVGYYLGEMIEFWLRGRPTALPELSATYPTAGKLLWGLCHGFGLGFGLSFMNDWFTRSVAND